MKTVRNNQPFIFLLMAVVLLNCCQPDDSGHPCDEPTIQETRLLDKYDSLFPYNHTSKRLVYLYSNDTIENDTMIFELQDYISWDIDTSVWDAQKCFIEYNEVQKLFYVSTSSVFKELIIFRDGGASFDWETRDKGKSFSYKNNKMSDFRVHPSIYRNKNETHANILDTHKIYGEMYKNVYQGIRYFKCDTVGSTLLYSPEYGFIDLYNACSSEHFVYIK